MKTLSCAILLALISLPAFGQETPKLTPLERVRPDHLQATREARLNFARERQPLPNLGVYEDFRAVIHVHAAFVHGGSWRSGDRAQYPALGNRFAKEGIVTVVPSYRLAPQNPHPAQIQDVAAAFAWVVENIAAHGGDPGRIWVAGHSAGGHLAALLALDESYLDPG